MFFDSKSDFDKHIIETFDKIVNIPVLFASSKICY